MFTGLIEEIGTIERATQIGGGVELRVLAPVSSAELKINDSVSINGACQTVVGMSGSAFDVQAVEETLKKTTLGALRSGSKVNIELPLRLDERLGGHMVLGHVDVVGKIVKIDPKDSSWLISIEIPTGYRSLIVGRGSIAIDGVSLTIAECADSLISVSIIPHTMEKTIFAFSKVGDHVNLEFDVLGKYVVNFLKGTAGDSGARQFPSLDQMRELGF